MTLRLQLLTIHELLEGPDIAKYKSLLSSAWGIFSAKLTLLSDATNAEVETVLTAKALENRRPGALSVSCAGVL